MVEAEESFRYPSFLPAEARVATLLVSSGPATDPQLTLLEFESGRSKTLRPGTRPVYSPSGHIVYESAGDLWALPFSIRRLEPLGEAFPIREDTSLPSVARDGTLVFLDSGAPGLKQLIWRDRGGRKLGEIGQPQGNIVMPVLSPDGRRVVALGDENRIRDVWLHEVSRPLKNRLTFTREDENRPTWTPEGDRVSYSRLGDIFIRPADGSGEEQVLLATPAGDYGFEWSTDGKYVVGSGQGEIWYLRADEDGGSYEKVSFLSTSFDELGPDLSRDGRFVAYESNESGRYEVHVQPFPEGGGKWQVSTNGGVQARWRADGKELFYVEGDTLMAVEVTTTPAFSVVGAARKLFTDKQAFGGRGQRYDVTPDGQRFVVVETLQEPPPPVIRVVLNWYEEFRDREQD